jgi:Na+/H+ antiporter 1
MRPFPSSSRGVVFLSVVYVVLQRVLQLVSLLCRSTEFKELEIILAVFYPSGSLSLWALIVFLPAAVLVAWWLRRRRTLSFWPYVIGPGVLSWTALYLGGFHPALALVPIVTLMPHRPRDLGLFDPRERHRLDTLNRFEHWWATPVQFVLLLLESPMRACRSRRSAQARITWWPGSSWASPSEFSFSHDSRERLVDTYRRAFDPAISS